jgi:large subunit ribosomal protein L25
MERVELRTESRMVRGKKVKRLRAEGWIPGVLYGPDTPSRALQVEDRALVRTLQEAGSTALINLFVDDEPKPNLVLARDIQRDILTGQLKHVDFFQVRLTEKVRTSPRLELVGESPLVKSGGAILVQILDQVEVECLPTDLINSIPVDLTGLASVDDSIVLGDLPVPSGVTILADPHDTVISLVPPRMAREIEEEEIAAEEAALAEAAIREAEAEEIVVEEEAESED